MLEQGTVQMEQELDIVKIIKAMRLNFLLYKYLLTPSQQMILRKQSESVLKSDEEIHRQSTIDNRVNPSLPLKIDLNNVNQTEGNLINDNKMNDVSSQL